MHAADLFGDADLTAAAVASRRVDRYPDGLIDAAAAFPPAPWCYTGAVENHRHVIERVSAARPLAGNGVAEVGRVREPAALAALVRHAGLRFPDTLDAPRDLPTDGSFLRKPVAGAGGRGIAPWLGGGGPAVPGFVWQLHIAGEAVSAVLCLEDDGSRVLGMSHQLVGTAWCRAARFAYAGSVGMPQTAVAVGIQAQFASLAASLAGQAGLRGVVGVDAIVEEGGRVVVLEINPRPTASAELVERTTGESILGMHLAAFGLASPVALPARHDAGIWSKAVLFAAEPVAIDDRMLSRLHALADPWTASDRLPAIADIPCPGQVLRGGGAMLTVFARGHTVAATAAALRSRIEAVKTVTG